MFDGGFASILDVVVDGVVYECLCVGGRLLLGGNGVSGCYENCEWEQENEGKCCCTARCLGSWRVEKRVASE